MQKNFIPILLLAIFFLSTLCLGFNAHAQVTVQPEYSQVESLSFPLQYYAQDFRNKRSLPLLWQEFLLRIALQTHQQAIDLNLLITTENQDHCDPENKLLKPEFKSHYPSIEAFERVFLERCSETLNTCHTQHLKYQCTQQQYSWLRNKAYLQVLDKTGEHAYLHMNYDKQVLSQELLPEGSKIIAVDLNWNGPADLFTDKPGGNIFITQRMLDNNGRSETNIEQTLRQSINFDQLVILKPNPWEYTQDTDTIVMFAKHPQTEVVHAFLSQQPEGDVLRRSLASSSYLSGDFLTLGQASNKELGKCNVTSQDLFLMSVFALNRWNDPFNFESRLRGFDLLAGHASQADFLGFAQEHWHNFADLYACYQNIAQQLNTQAKNNDAYNYQTLLKAGFTQETIHWLPSPGVYSNSERSHSTYAASYVNGVILNDTYLMPVFPSFDQADVVFGRDQTQIQQAFEALGPSDRAAMTELKKVFKQVIPIRSDFLTGGAIHCTSTCSYR